MRLPDWQVSAHKAWGDGVALAHAGAVALLAEFLPAESKGMELEAVGHRVVPGGPDNALPVRIYRETVAAL